MAESDQVAVADFRALYIAWRQCRRRKRATPQAQRYEISLLDRLTTTVQALDEGRWRPAPPVCFAVSKPKAREIHAASFADRVVHHWLVPCLEALYEPIFIHDVYSNRKGKGTHAAVNRLLGFMRSLSSNVGSIVMADSARLPQSLPILRNDGWIVASQAPYNDKSAVIARSQRRCGNLTGRQHATDAQSLHGGVRNQVIQIIVREQGYLHGGLKRRVLEKAFIKGRLDCAASA